MTGGRASSRAAFIDYVIPPTPQNSSTTATRPPGFFPDETASHTHSPSTPTTQTIRHTPFPSRQSTDPAASEKSCARNKHNCRPGCLCKSDNSFAESRFDSSQSAEPLNLPHSENAPHPL